MANPLDLQEQEQLDALKAFWKTYGNLVTWLLILVLGAFAAWNGWNWWQRDQALKAGAMFDELERAAQAGDAGVVEFVARCRDSSGATRLHETSRFVRQDGRWWYIDGQVTE